MSRSDHYTDFTIDKHNAQLTEAEEKKQEQINANLSLLQSIGKPPKTTEEQRTEARKKIDEFNRVEYLRNNYVGS